jgi:uncharacterized protein (UPF0332 family)
MATAAFDWSQYFQLAEELAKRTEESALRSALSRAYYYVYHLALQRAQANGFTALSGEGTHKQLWRTFNGSPEPDCRKLAEIASRLKEKRERADYEDNYRRLADEVPEVLADAQRLCNSVAAVESTSPEPSERSAMMPSNFLFRGQSILLLQSLKSDGQRQFLFLLWHRCASVALVSRRRPACADVVRQHVRRDGRRLAKGARAIPLLFLIRGSQRGGIGGMELGITHP